MSLHFIELGGLCDIWLELSCEYHLYSSSPALFCQAPELQNNEIA